MIRFDPSSFKDPAARMFSHGDWICRTLSPVALRDFTAARDAGLVRQLVDGHLLVEAEVVSASELGLADAGVGEFVLKQRRVPIVTYSYEWSFEMLRDAALTTLEILQRSLAAGFILKDANAFNIVFDGNRPTLVDAPSIETYRPGAAWAGYAQFCRSFLFPLLVASYRGVDVHLLLRATLGELSVHDAAKLLRLRDCLRPGVMRDVLLQARLERAFASSPSTVASTVSQHSIPKASLQANIDRLHSVIETLRAPSSATEWSEYGTCHTYSDEDRGAKMAFIERVLTERQPRRIADLGCNTGDYTRLALRTGASAIALDLDARCVDRLYRTTDRPAPLFPIVASLLNPTPAMGWALAERRSLLERMSSDMFLALALIHHLRITGGVPLASIVGQLFDIAPEGVIEWVDKDDSMVGRMLSLRLDVYDDYTWPAFESIVGARAEIVSCQPTHDGRRRLCHVRARGNPS